MRSVPTLTATSYQMSLETGRTTPGVFLCEDEHGNPAGEYVVKLRGNIETGNGGLLREIVGSILADELGIMCPQPAIVDVPGDLASAITDSRVVQAVRRSSGLNFGSRNITGGYFAWPDEKPIPPSLRSFATDIFVFDALIHNPDRRRGKPNLLWKGNELVVIDHEMAFSFLLAVPAVKQPWLLAEQPYLIEHIFFQHLKETEINLDRIIGSIEALNEDIWEGLTSIVPETWKGTEFERIRKHIKSVQQHLTEFVSDARRMLK